MSATAPPPLALPASFRAAVAGASGEALFITRNNVLAARGVAEASPGLAWTTRT